MVETPTLPIAAPPVLPRALRRFLATEASGGVVLLLATIAALVWANSPWHESYEALWETVLSIRIGGLGIQEDLRHWVNDALMAIFFFVAGLEIKRELVVGQLRTWRQASLPAVAALGGMVVPATIFLALNPRNPAAQGWGIPMATDIAFALGVLALMGRRAPGGLKLFLLTLAIVDDIGAIVVIAFFYTQSLSPLSLFVAGALLLAMIGLRALRIAWMPAYALVGLAFWLAVFESGIHATIAGVILGLLVPARPLAPTEVARDWARELAEEPTPTEMADMARIAKATVSEADRFEHALHPFSSFIIVPVFALANAGVVLSRDALTGDATGRIALSVAVALVAGKLMGVLGGAALAVRLKVGALPVGVGWRQIAGAAGLAGIGFTVSLFITDLAYDDVALQTASKIGILGASVIASIVGAVLLLSRPAEAGR